MENLTRYLNAIRRGFNRVCWVWVAIFWFCILSLAAFTFGAYCAYMVWPKMFAVVVGITVALILLAIYSEWE